MFLDRYPLFEWSENIALCVTLPAVVLGRATNGKWKIKSVRGATSEVTSLIDSVDSGDYVSVFSGAIVDKLTKKTYEETVSLWEEIRKSMEDAGVSFVQNSNRGRKNGTSDRGGRKRSL